MAIGDRARRFREGRAAGITLTPITLGFGKKRPDRGYPVVADAATAAQILERLQRLSKPFGTNIVVRNGIGVIAIEK
ncbi:MAG TPA: hypothetical protein VGH37_17610 [Candidatus Acidoferrum sp.]